MDLVRIFETKVEVKLGLKNLVQVSMDGPNVNWSCFEKLQAKMENDYSSKLIDIGSCGLHILHNAYKSGVSETKWDIGYKLYCLHTLFDNVPARRDDFEKSTKTYVFPLPFCSHRWVENVRVCQRAIEILPALTLYINAVESKKVKNPDTKSFAVVKSMCKDHFLKAKLEFIVCTAKTVESFLKSYQTEKPVLSFFGW